MKKHLLFGLLLTLAACFNHAAWAQGVTTSSLSGYVTDANGEALPMANVTAIHTPTGTKYGIATQIDGNFTINNMKIGGPYKVSASFVGYEEQVIEGIFLKLGEQQKVEFVLSDGSVQLTDVVITGEQDNTMNEDRTGAATTVGREQLAVLPTIKRSAKDFTRLTPQSDGNSFGGRNNLYNNFSLDGSIFNNSFGLDVSTPGGQTDAQPVSMDAIDQIQVSMAPFDVRQGGFTGAGVNAVTRSGSNEFEGSAYTFGRNESMVGNQVAGQQVENLDFMTFQSGFRLGGPILKNKLFFFVNAEAERRNQVAHGFVAAKNESEIGGNVTSVIENDVIAVQQHLMDEWGYDAGAYQNYEHETYNNKFLLKLDWNINDNHELTFRYNYLDSWKDILPHPEAIGGRGPQPYRLPFANSSYRINNDINSYVAELNSRFGNNASNKLLVSYTAFRDVREPWSEPFPVIDILNGNGVVAITAGSEMFSTNNKLNQDVFQFTDNFTYFANKHVITAGVNLEVFQFDNSFNLFYYPWYTYGSVDDFLATTKADVDFNADVANSQKNDFEWAYVDVAQFAGYVQDEFQPNERLKLTLGLRFDMPIYLNEVARNEKAASFDGFVNTDGEQVTVDPSVWPTARMMWSPRFGFNWDVMGDRSLQVRGGSGIFTGRIPFVWLGNQSSNARIDPFYEFQVNATAQDFRFPQVWKNNIAADWKFAKGWVATLEGIYSKDLNAVIHRNYNMRKPSMTAEGADNRAIFAGFNETNIFSSSPAATDADGTPYFLDAGAIVLENTPKGHQYSVTGQLSKAWESGLNASASYTYLESKDLTSIPAEIAADAFQRNPVVGDPNAAMFSWSRYGLKHRIIASASYKKSYRNMSTSIAGFFEAGKGGRYSYRYAGDMNRDAIVNNDLIYVPADQSEISLVEYTNASGETVTVEEQWTALDAFISQDPYLSTRRGDYAERNGAMLPWYTQFDIRVLQDFNFDVAGRTNTVQLSFDILNFGNMMNSDWGVRQLPTTTLPISAAGYEGNKPNFTFDPSLKSSFTNDVSLASKWQMQVGLRYIF